MVATPSYPIKDNEDDSHITKTGIKVEVESTIETEPTQPESSTEQITKQSEPLTQETFETQPEATQLAETQVESTQLVEPQTEAVNTNQETSTEVQVANETYTPERPESNGEAMTIALQPGESVYNENTGIEIGYNGAASENGERIENKNLEYDDNGNALVNINDLNNEANQPNVYTNLDDSQKTGLEVSEEEFLKGKSDQEIDNISLAAQEEFMRYLEENNFSR